MAARQDSFRVVHFTDVHIQPEREAFAGVSRALEAVHQLAPKVDAILLGGDVVMNSVSVGLDRVNEQWDLWDRAISQFPNTPVLPCIGNQDCWGWNLKSSRCTGNEPLFGKKMAMHRLGMERSFYSQRLGDWRLIALDDLTQGGKHGYVARLDPEQRAWLESELEADPATPTVVMGHVPIVIGPADFFSSDILGPEKTGDWHFPGQHVHVDSFDLVALFAKFPNVKLCLAGHTHCVQRIDYCGTSYVHSAAVSGEWWRGDYRGFAPGFTVIDLAPDGSFTTQPVTY